MADTFPHITVLHIHIKNLKKELEFMILNKNN